MFAVYFGWQESATEAVHGDEQGGLIVNIASCSKKKEKNR